MEQPTSDPVHNPSQNLSHTKATRDIVVIGGSLGGLEALRALIAGLPADFPAAILVVLHISPHTPSQLHLVLQSISALPVAPAVDGEPVVPGRIYVASSDRHLMIEHDHIRLTRGPRESHSRPSIDVLFRSAAYNYGPRVIGIVLSGALDDGTAGLWAIKDRGGRALVQAPAEAINSSMPQSALNHVRVDAALLIAEMPAQLAEWTREVVDTEEDKPVSEGMKIEHKIALEENPIDSGWRQLGDLSNTTCPECHGVMVKIQEGSIIRYRCHTGHSYH
jgi:two-component system chemotaxis response regulator CheB